MGEAEFPFGETEFPIAVLLRDGADRAKAVEIIDRLDLKVREASPSEWTVEVWSEPNDRAGAASLVQRRLDERASGVNWRDLLNVR